MSPLEATVPLDPCPLWTQPPLDGPLTMVKVTRASRGPIASGKSPPPPYARLFVAVISSHRSWEIAKKPSLSISRFRVSSSFKSFDCKTVLLPFYAFTSLSNFIIETSSTFWITRGLWRRFNVETTTTVLYTRFTFQFWNTVGKLSKRKSKFEYWLNAEGKSFLKYLLKTAFSLKSHPSNLHRFNRGTLS